MSYEIMRVRDFIAANWADFEQFCEDNQDDADEIYDSLDGH